MRASFSRNLHHQAVRLLPTVIMAMLLACIPVSGATAEVNSLGANVEMTREEAGDYYLLGACKQGDANDKFARIIWHGRDHIGAAEVSRRLPELKRLSAALARATHSWARHLYNPPAAWPADVLSKARELAAKNVRYEQFRRRQAYATNAAQWLNNNGKANNVKFGTLAPTIRARLDLPPSGRGC